MKTYTNKANSLLATSMQDWYPAFESYRFQQPIIKEFWTSSSTMMGLPEVSFLTCPALRTTAVEIGRFRMKREGWVYASSDRYVHDDQHAATLTVAAMNAWFNMYCCNSANTGDCMARTCTTAQDGTTYAATIAVFSKDRLAVVWPSDDIDVHLHSKKHEGSHMWFPRRLLVCLATRRVFAQL